MTTFIKIGLSLLLLSSLLGSCKKNFVSLNTDPDNPSTVTPGVILSQLQYRMVVTGVTTARSFTHELMQMSAPRISSDGLDRKSVV